MPTANEIVNSTIERRSAQLERSVKDMEERLARAMFGDNAERRVNDLRRSILGDEAPCVSEILGLSQAIR